MDNQRLFLFVALSFVVLMLWQSWVEDYRTPAEEVDVAASAPAEDTLPSFGDMPVSETVTPSLASALPEESLLASDQRIHVVTDVFDVEIDTRGGDIRRVDLTAYPETSDAGSVPVRLMNDTLPNLFFTQTGLRTPDGEEPTHHVTFTPEKTEYRLGDNEDELHVALHWRSDEGIEVTKRFTFKRGSYEIGIQHQVHNQSGELWRGRQYRQLQRNEQTDSNQAFIYTYTGGVLYSPEEKYEKIDFDDMADGDLNRTVTDGWAAMIQHYFLGALIPEVDEENRYYTKSLGDGRYVIGLISPLQQVYPGESAVFDTTLYVGPKLQRVMEEVAPGLDLTVDYGVLTVLAKPLFIAMEFIHRAVGNWGWTIIIVTMLIKLVFYKLSETSYRSMANMRKLTPRMKSLKERYKDDRQRLNQAMMEMYKKEKVNPLGGCLPILVQIPVFISLYWVLLESVEMRQAPFIFWLNDLSSADPYFVLPLLMGATMLIQQKLNPAPLDPIQAKVMMALPVVFTVFFAFFPSGLVLYWVVNNTLSIAQQWVITRRIERGGK